MWAALSLALVLASYLLGSIPPAFLAARLRKGIDLRRYGSGNVGSSNLGKQLGSAWAVGSGSVDFAKGLLPVVLAQYWGFDLSVSGQAGVAAVIGHDWSLYIGFKGGRGMGTAIGVLTALDIRLAILFLAVLAIAWVARQGATGSAVALLLLAPAAWLLGDPGYIAATCLMIALVIALKRMEANGLPLPSGARQRWVVLFRRLWMDRDVPPGQPWEDRERIV